MDGGLTALGGFLYQTVVALSLKADAFQEYHDAPVNKGDLETLLGFAKDGEVRYEDEDQDVSIRNVLHGEKRGYILVQLKYSSLSPRPPLTKYDLRNIIARLQASKEKACVHGRQVTGYSLLTNRPLNEEAKKMIESSNLPFYVTSSLPEHYWEERLQQFARRFSCIDSEIQNGIRKGIGELMLRVTNPGHFGEPVITREMLIELFTGCQTAHELTPNLVAKKARQHINTLFTQSFHLNIQPLLVRQSIHTQLSYLVERHAFVVLSGGGGNGKTAALWQWMDGCFTSKLPQQLGIYYSLSPSQFVQEDFFAHQFCTWANVPKSHHWRVQEPEVVLDRLEIARSAGMQQSSVGHPIFVLGLDAVDEIFQEHEQHELRHLLMWFWEQEVHLRQTPRATLIITCRNSKELADRWLSITSPFEDDPKPFRHVEVVVDEFDAGELVAAARLYLPALAERFEQAYRVSAVQPLAFPSTLEAPSVLQSENSLLKAVDAEVFKALRHPALWHCLLSITDSDMIQSQVLDGEIDALARLSYRFLSWFCTKARARGKRTRKEDMIEVLKAIAHQCDPCQSLLYRNKDWITSASKTSYMNAEQAEHFFEEALSAGLLVRESKGWWRWRHPFIGEYLVAQPLDEEDE